MNNKRLITLTLNGQELTTSEKVLIRNCTFTQSSSIRADFNLEQDTNTLGILKLYLGNKIGINQMIEVMNHEQFCLEF